MQIYNSLTNKLEDFKSIKEKEITMYICGPTVNKRTHLGHMLPVIFFDVVYRYFNYLGYKVNYISNFTDIDDKIIASAKEEGITEVEVADRYAKFYLEDIAAMNCLDINQRPKVTEFMDEIIIFIQELISKGFAYQSGKDVYFNVDKIKEYGKLSNQKVEDLNYGNRIGVNDDKHNPYDFALWKSTEEGIKWKSPFGEGRPGWHTECVVMINSIFNGSMIDIHGGGIDLKFPHHENEIAQSNALYNNDIAKFWMHNGHLFMDGEKMSKSLGNVLTVPDLLEDYSANTIRLAFLKNHYRLPLTLNKTAYEESQTIDEKVKNALKQAKLYIDLNNLETGLTKEDKTVETFMNDDFNTSMIVTYLLESTKGLNYAVRNENNEQVVGIYDRMNIVNYILGLKYELKELTEEDKETYNKWLEARGNKDFELADELREKLTTLGIL